MNNSDSQQKVSKRLKTSTPSVIPENTEQRHLRIYKAIRERISLLQYAPGTVLSETELATEFGVSRTPIRRVLQRLHYEGLTEIRNGIGTIVKDIDLKTLKEIYDLRMPLADLMGVLSPVELTPTHLADLQRLLKQTRALKSKKDYEAYARLCNELEEIMISMTGNAPLRGITDMLYYQVSRIWFTFLPQLNWPEMVDFQVEEISAMIEAVKRHDIEAVGHIRRRHLNGVLVFLSNYLAGRAVGDLPVKV